MDEPSDLELIRRFGADDPAVRQAAFTVLFERHQKRAFDLAYRVLGDSALAADAAQEAFIIAYRELKQLRDAASFGPWLLRIAGRRALRLKRNRNVEQTGTEYVDLVTAPSDDWMEPYADVVRQLARLPEHERIVTIMRYVNGLSVKEIADSTGRPVGTITKQLSRAIGRLRSWLIQVQS